MYLVMLRKSLEKTNCGSTYTFNVL